MTTPAPERISPRLARKEKKKVVKETALLFIGAVVIAVVFIMFILPWFFALFLKIVGSGDSTNETGLPPQVPVFAAPIDATSSAQLTMSGYTESEAEVTLVINDEEIETKKANAEGNFEFEVDLEEGDNVISAFAAKGELESALSQRYTVIFDNKKPKLEVAKPDDKQTVEGRANQLFTVSGVTDPDAHVLINGRAVYPNSKGEFTSSIQLNEGENKVELKAIDRAKNETEVVRTVTFKL